jgi:hypothetical protein
VITGWILTEVVTVTLIGITILYLNGLLNMIVEFKKSYDYEKIK